MTYSKISSKKKVKMTEKTQILLTKMKTQIVRSTTMLKVNWRMQSRITRSRKLLK